jgi:hypothetical protein
MISPVIGVDYTDLIADLAKWIVYHVIQRHEKSVKSTLIGEIIKII